MVTDLLPQGPAEPGSRAITCSSTIESTCQCLRGGPSGCSTSHTTHAVTAAQPGTQTMTPCGCYCPLRKHCRARPLTLQAAAGLQVQAGEGGGRCQWCQVSIHQVGQAPQAEGAQAAQLRQHLGVAGASIQQGRKPSMGHAWYCVAHTGGHCRVFLPPEMHQLLHCQGGQIRCHLRQSCTHCCLHIHAGLLLLCRAGGLCHPAAHPEALPTDAQAVVQHQLLQGLQAGQGSKACKQEMATEHT